MGGMQVAQGSEKQPEHCAAGWCSDCHTVVADPSADPSDVLTAVAGLAAGSLSMPGSSLGAGVGSAGGWQDAALQIHGALLGVPAAGENQVRTVCWQLLVLLAWVLNQPDTQAWEQFQQSIVGQNY